MLLDTRHGKTISSHSSDFQTFKSKGSLPFHTDVHYCIELQKEKSIVMFFLGKNGHSCSTHEKVLSCKTTAYYMPVVKHSN